jgi:hypothetical protein
VRKAGTRGHHVDPFAYMRDVFQKTNAHPQSRLAELPPDRWLAQRTAAPDQSTSVGVLLPGGARLRSGAGAIRSRNGPNPSVPVRKTRRAVVGQFSTCGRFQSARRPVCRSRPGGLKTRRRLKTCPT